MPDTVNGIPTHPLLVHFAVVLALLAVGLGILWVIPRTRGWVRHAFPLTALAAAVFVFLAKGSGEGLEERVESGAAGWDGSALERLLEDHEEAADLMLVLSIAFAIVAVVSWWLGRSQAERMGGALGVAMSVVILVVGVGVAIQMYRVGDLGAKATWQHSVPLGAGEGADEDEGRLAPAAPPVDGRR